MMRTLLLGMVLLVVSPAVYSQEQSEDGKTMQAVLQEIRQLRQDLQAASLAARRAQILLYRLGMQQGVVDRAREETGELKNELVQAERMQGFAQMQLKRAEELKEKGTNEAGKQQEEESIEDFQQQLEEQTQRIQELQVKLTRAEETLRLEVAKLERLEEELDRLEESLERATLQARNP